jgi:hypothetical protein
VDIEVAVPSANDDRAAIDREHDIADVGINMDVIQEDDLS